MAKLSDIHASQSGEELKSKIDHVTPFLGNDEEELEGDFVIFRLASNKKKGRVYIDGIDDIYNPQTKKVERARLLSGVESIWMKDQKDLDKEYVRANRRSLVFEGRVCRLPKWDTQAIEFARATKHCISDHSKNTGGMYAYFEWNPKRQAEAALAKRTQKVDAMKKALTVTDVQKMKKHAFYLGVLSVDEMGIPKKDEAIRDEYVMKAEENPELFLKTFESLVVDITYLVTKAITDTKIDLGRERGMAYFTTCQFICSIPPQRTPKEVLVELATSKTKEGKDFLEKLQAAVN